ncbi:MAG: DinB family protein, partial [Candidatus Methylomirabilales bacterium]
MALSLQDLKTLYAFNAWARGRMLDAVAQVDEAAYRRDLGSSFGSLEATLVHILGAEELYLKRWRG